MSAAVRGDIVGWRSAVMWTGLVSVALSIAFLIAAPMGTDLSAQQARADFTAHFGATPIDLRWYGGTQQFGYSLISQFLMAALTPRVTGAIALVVSSVALAYVLVRTGARRPILGGVLCAGVGAANLVSGRITFGLGFAFGALALAALATPSDTPAPTRPGTRATMVATLLAALSTWASPIAGMFVFLAGSAVLLGGLRRRPDGRWHVAHLAPGAALCVGSGAALVPMLVVSDGGTEPYSRTSMLVSVALVAVVALLVPVGSRVVRVGALLLIALLVGAYVLPSPIGYNATRLSFLYGAPVLGGLASFDVRLVAATLAAMIWWQSPLGVDDLTDAGSPASRPSFYRALDHELSILAPIGRVEVVPLRDHWESVYVAATVPLARGWERQVDVVRNPLFYTPVLDAADYDTWLHDQAVSYVALATTSAVEFHGRTEAAVVRAAPPFLRPVWSDRDWQLFAVLGPTPIVSTPAQLIRSTAERLEFSTTGPGDTVIRVRWSRWLSVRGARVTPGPDGWTSVRVPTAGRYTLSSSLVG